MNNITHGLLNEPKISQFFLVSYAFLLTFYLHYFLSSYFYYQTLGLLLLASVVLFPVTYVLLKLTKEFFYVPDTKRNGITLTSLLFFWIMGALLSFLQVSEFVQVGLFVCLMVYLAVEIRWLMYISMEEFDREKNSSGDAQRTVLAVPATFRVGFR